MDPLIIRNNESSLKVEPKTDTVEISVGDNKDGTTRTYSANTDEAIELFRYFLKAAVKISETPETERLLMGTSPANSDNR